MNRKKEDIFGKNKEHKIVSVPQFKKEVQIELAEEGSALVSF